MVFWMFCSSRFPPRSHQIVDPELDNCEVVTGVPVMHEVESALLPEPGKAIQGRVYKVVVFVQIHMPTECREDTCEMGEHDQRTEIQVNKYGESDDRNAVVVQGMRFAVLKFFGLQFVSVVQPVMSNCMSVKHRRNAFFVSIVPMQNGLHDGHQVIRNDGNPKKYYDVHTNLQNHLVSPEIPPNGRPYPEATLMNCEGLADVHAFFEFRLSESWRNVLRAVPVERHNIDSHNPLNLGTVIR